MFHMPPNATSLMMQENLHPLVQTGWWLLMSLKNQVRNLHIFLHALQQVNALN